MTQTKIEQLRNRIVHLKKLATKYNKAIQKRKKALKQYSDLCDWLLDNNRVTKKELSHFIKRKED